MVQTSVDFSRHATRKDTEIFNRRAYVFDSLAATLMQKDEAILFLVGNHGNFDRMALSILRKIKEGHPYIRYQIVLAYMPKACENEIEDTVLADGVENTLPRFAIEKRNQWMIEQSDVVVTYVTRSFGGAAKFKRMALAKGKRVIEISD